MTSCIASSVMCPLEVGQKHISAICGEMTCALFAHIAPSAPFFLRDYFVDEVRRVANLFFHNLLFSLYFRK